jgi:AraC-like DNA-binding protein
VQRHSPALSFGHSGVGWTQDVGIQFAMLNVASSAIVAVLMASDLNDMLDTLMSIRHSPDSSQLEALNHEYLEKVVLERTLRILSNSTARSSQMPLGSAYRITQAAQALIESSPEEPLTVMTLCQDLGVSRASLQRCFLQIHGVAPLAYLRMRRLNCARRALKAARGTNATVTAIAMHWEYFHFARDSRKIICANLENFPPRHSAGWAARSPRLADPVCNVSADGIGTRFPGRTFTVYRLQVDYIRVSAWV